MKSLINKMVISKLLKGSSSSLAILKKIAINRNDVRFMSSGIGHDIFKEHSLTQDQVQLRDLVHSFLKKELPTSVAAQIDREDDYPSFRDLWKKLGGIGLHGITAPKQYGGLEMGFLEHCIAMEVMSQYSSAIALSYGAHSNLNINQISLNGTEKQKEMYLPGLIDGSLIGALAMSETNSGSDVISMRTKAEKKGDYYVLNGSKFWITNGPVADVFLVYAKTGNKEITAFLIEKDTPGFTLGKKLIKLGMRGSPTGELIFEDCIVPDTSIVGGLGQGVYVLMSGLDYERLVLSAGPLGIMQRACDLAFDYALRREQFGTPLSDFQLIQGMMASMYTQTMECRATLYSTAKDMDNSMANKLRKSIKGTNEFTAKCAAIKWRSSEAAWSVADQALQIFGGNGYTEDYEISRLLRDARLYRIGAGTSEICLTLIAREIKNSYMTRN